MNLINLVFIYINVYGKNFIFAAFEEPPFTHDQAVKVDEAFNSLAGGITTLILSLRNVTLALGFYLF